jgi:hypothetical protein
MSGEYFSFSKSKDAEEEASSPTQVHNCYRKWKPYQQPSFFLADRPGKNDTHKYKPIDKDFKDEGKKDQRAEKTANE